MAEDGLLPATAVRVTVHPPPSSPRSVTWIPKGKRSVVVRSIAPLVIVGVVLLLFLGGTGGILLLVGVAVIAATLLIAVQYRKSVSRRLYSTDPDDWMSRVAFYLGPFDRTGLPDAASFERRNSSFNNPPQVRLLVTDHGFVFGPAGHSGTPLCLPFNEVESVDLIGGDRPRMLIVTPPISQRVGQVVLRTTDGHLAKFSGLPIRGVQDALRDKGATTEVEG